MADISSSSCQQQRKRRTAIATAAWLVVAVAFLGEGQAWSPSPRSRCTVTPPVTSRTDVTTSTSTTGSTQEPRCVQQDDTFLSSRRQWVTQTTTTALLLVTTTIPPPARAEDAAAVVVDPVAVRQAFDAVRREVLSETGGVAYLQKAVDEQNFPALLEFTKTYDQILRKGAMGKAKKWIVNPADKDAATAAANGVTFDLIGINKSARPGQENVDNARKYLRELVQDVQTFLDLEPKFSE